MLPSGSGLPFDVEKGSAATAATAAVLAKNAKLLKAPPSPSTPPPPLMVMLSGYPDTAASWNRLASHFQSTHHILQMAMPGYEDDTLEKEKFWGYPLQHICDALHELIVPYKNQGCPIHLVGHDWGAGIVLVYMQQNKPVDKAVILDVGAMKELPFKSIAVAMLYQSYFALTFLISRLLPKETWALPMLMIFPHNLVGPCPYEVRTTDYSSQRRRKERRISLPITWFWGSRSTTPSTHQQSKYYSCHCAPPLTRPLTDPLTHLHRRKSPSASRTLRFTCCTPTYKSFGRPKRQDR